MPSLPELRDIHMRSLARRGIQAPRHRVLHFLRFLTKGNVIQYSIGVAMGTAFNNIVNSLVTNVFNPIIGLAGTKNLENLFISLKGDGSSYSTPALANANNVVTLNYGAVFSSIIAFIIVSLLCYAMANTLLEYMNNNFRDPDTAECNYCKEKVNPLAIKCPHCHSIDPSKTSIKIAPMEKQETELSLKVPFESSQLTSDAALVQQ